MGGGSGTLTNAIIPTRALFTKGSTKDRLWKWAAPGIAVFKGKGQPTDNTSAPVIKTAADEQQELREKRLTALRRGGINSTLLSTSQTAASEETLGRRSLVS